MRPRQGVCWSRSNFTVTWQLTVRCNEKSLRRHSVSAMNKPENLSLPIVSFGGIGSATSLAKFYGLLANDGVMDGRRLFETRTVSQMSTALHDGLDVVFEIPTAFSAGFMVDSAHASSRIFGSAQSAFGHPGAGGS